MTIDNPTGLARGESTLQPENAQADLPSLDIITINYKGQQHLAACFQSLRDQDYPSALYRTVCLDNASEDGSVEYIRSEHPDIELIASDENLGFAAGCNFVAQKSSADYIVFLNNDTRVHEQFLHGLVEVLDPDRGLVCTAAKMVDWAGAQVDFVEGHITFHGFARQAHWREDLGNPRFDDSRPLLFACGGAMLIDRKIFNDLGGFDERFWMFFEDVDFGWRLWLAGYQVAFAPNAVCHHRHHAAAEGLSVYRRNFLYERNALFMLFKNLEQANLDRILPASLMLMVHRTSDYLQRAKLGIDLLEPEIWNQLDVAELEQEISLGDLAPLVAMRAVMQDMPQLMQAREKVQALRKRPDREIMPLLGQPRRMYPMGHLLIQSYCRAHQNLWAAFGLKDIFGHVPCRIAILCNDGIQALGFDSGEEGRRAESIGVALRAAGHDIVYCIPDRFLDDVDPQELPARIKRFAWNDQTLDARLIRLGPDVIIATHWRCLAFARLAAFRPVVLDVHGANPWPQFEHGLKERFEGEHERKIMRRILKKKDYLQNVDRFMAASDLDRSAFTAILSEVERESFISGEIGLLSKAQVQDYSPSPASRDDYSASGTSQGMADLEEYCRFAVAKPDKLGIDFQPKIPATPVWALPIKAVKSYRKHGGSQLINDIRQYRKWIGDRITVWKAHRKSGENSIRHAERE